MIWDLIWDLFGIYLGFTWDLFGIYLGPTRVVQIFAPVRVAHRATCRARGERQGRGPQILRRSADRYTMRPRGAGACLSSPLSRCNSKCLRLHRRSGEARASITKARVFRSTPASRRPSASRPGTLDPSHHDPSNEACVAEVTPNEIRYSLAG